MNASLALLGRCEGEGLADWQLVVFCEAKTCGWYYCSPFVPFGTRPAFGALDACPRCQCAALVVACLARGGRV